MNWLLVILFLNVPTGWEVHGYQFNSVEDCRHFARDINEKQNFANEEANRDGRVVGVQVYSWCEKNVPDAVNGVAK